MNGEDGGDKCASPDFSSERVERKKERDDGKGVKDNAVEMVQTGIYPEQLAIQHMRQGGDGMPVGGVKMSEGPCEVGETQPAGHAIGAINVIGIIVTDPIEVRGLPKDNPDQRDKREGDQKFLRLQTEAQTIHGGR